MTHIEIRQKFLKFFEARGHKIVPSSSLLPTDPSVLFTSAGMQPMMPYLLGETHPLGTRIANSQKCFRSQDIEEVGDNRHTTFFEMLGNWSFGDYFKEEQLSWMFEFLIKEIGLDPKKLYATAFAGDEQFPRDTESVNLWKGLFASVGIEAKDIDNPETQGMLDGRIFYYGVKKNWWSREGVPSIMSVGEPGGPDSEMFYEFSDIEHDPKYGPVCHVNCDCGRYLEIGNNVFMEYVKKDDGSFAPLPSKNVDFGGGLERITSASENGSDIFQTSYFRSIIDSIEKISNKKYSGESRRHFQVIADHTKASVMLIGDGVIPSNKTQGYLLRRLIRRSIRFGRLLGLEHSFLEKVAEPVIEMYKNDYPELMNQQERILKQLNLEEERFGKTINKGLREIDNFSELDGTIAFKLYETFGFPFELTEEIARERGQKVEYGEFRKSFEKHQEKSRAGAEKKFGGHGLLLDTGELKAGNEEELKKATRLHTATHLLHASLRKILGNEVHQAGSDITAERLRFDFTFPRKLTPEEIKQVEDLVNGAVVNDYQVNKKEMPYEEAIKSGALAFFKLKYPDRVNVYTISPDKYDSPSTGSGQFFSKELCGGPHVTHTPEIGRFKITKEEAISAGTRRIRAIVE